MKENKCLPLVFLAFLVLCPFSMRGQIWLGTINSDWNTAGNWSSGVVPTSLQVATFNTAAPDCVISGNISVEGINITNGYVGTISITDGGTFTVGNLNYVQAGATFNCGNGAFVCGNNTSFNQSGGMFISSSNTIALGGDINFFSQGFIANGGTVLLNSASSANITVDGNNTASATLNNLIIDMTTSNQPTNNYLLGGNSTLLIQGGMTINRGCFNGTLPGHILLSGNFSMAQTGTAGNLTSNVDLEFVGSANTTVTMAAGGETLYNGGITLNKANPDNTVTLNSPLIMNNQTNSKLTFIMGKLVTTQVNILTIESNNVEWSGASDNSFVDGPMIKVGGSGNSGFVFPIGDNGKYAPLVISGANNSIANFGMTAAHSFRAEYVRADPNSTYDVSSRDGTLSNIGRCEYWVLDRLVDPGNNADPFVWLSYDNLRSCGISQPADLRIANWNGSLWTDLGNALVTNDGISFVSTSSIVTTFSPFDLASTDPITNPLPVTLLDFIAYQQQNFVHLEWSTASENNSDHFTIERSGDGAQFDSLTVIPAAGNSNFLLNYGYDDKSIPDGRVYYRLKLTDKDGRVTYSKTITGVHEITAGVDFFPNPVSDRGNLNIRSKKKGVLLYRIIDNTGRLFGTETVAYSQGASTWPVITSHLPKGIYYLEIEGTDINRRISFIKQ
jgi:hypothetical protein